MRAAALVRLSLDWVSLCRVTQPALIRKVLGVFIGGMLIWRDLELEFGGVPWGSGDSRSRSWDVRLFGSRGGGSCMGAWESRSWGFAISII